MKILKRVDGFVGRGADFNPPNRFEEIHLEPFTDDIDYSPDDGDAKLPTKYYADHSRSILAKNDSPDVGFTYSINPYRGCEHGCIYCYARPSHEYLGFSSGLDFETKIMVKLDAPELLAEAFRKPSWQPQVVALSGNTDCYQPIERKLQITRRCLEVFLQFRNPVSIITKNALIQRDIDLLKDLAALNLVSTVISITTLDRDLVKHMEPRTASPWKRLQTIEKLATHGIPVGVNVAPIIPGLNDSEIPEILKYASERGARFAGKIMLRLPHAVKDLFVAWLQCEYPERSSKVINRIKGMRDGKLSEAAFGTRIKGEGEYAAAIDGLFRSSCVRYQFQNRQIPLAIQHFWRAPQPQIELF